MNPRRAGGRVRSQRGQGTIEFQIVMAGVLLPLLMAVLQIGLLVMAKNTLNVATLGAARAGAASGGERDAMTDALALGLAPLNVAGAKEVTGVGMNDITAANYGPVMAAAVVTAKANNLLFSKISVLNPTRDSFIDFGVVKNGLGKIIPVTSVYDNAAVGARSHQTRADALLLKIEVRYCQKLVVPIIDKLILEVFNAPLSGASLDDRACYLLGRVPLVSQAVVRMTVPPIEEKLI